jgi:hypothetical protein
MTAAEIRRAAELLPRCKTLGDAEKHFGGAMRKGERDHKKAAVAWGMFDGFAGRPDVVGAVFEHHAADYREAYEIGRRISLDEVPA